MADPQRLLRQIERYLADTGMSDSRLGVLLLNDPNFMRHLRNGTRDFRVSTLESAESGLRLLRAAQSTNRTRAA